MVLLVDSAYSAVRTTAINSSYANGSGLACILLAFVAVSGTPGISASVTPFCTERWDIRFGGGCSYPVYAVLYARFGAAGKQTRDGRGAFESRMVRCTGAHCSHISCHLMCH